VVSKQALVGSECEMLVAARLCQQQAIPFLPVVGGSTADIIAELDGRLIRIQVKAMVLKEGKRVRLERGGNSDNKRCRRYTPDEIDFIAVVDRKLGIVFVVPCKEGQASISLEEIAQYGWAERLEKESAGHRL